MSDKTNSKRKRLAAAVLLSAATLVSTAQINSPEARGYMARGLQMYRLGNYNGCIDQLTAMQDSELTPAERETRDWTLAMAAYHTSGPASINSFKKFIATYPQSVLLSQAQLRIADCMLTVSVPMALKAYLEIDPNTLPANLREELAYHTAYCYMNLADFERARSIFSILTRNRQWGNASRFYLAYIDYVDGDYNKALKGFASTNQNEEPANAAPYYMSQIYYYQRNWDRSLQMARQLLAIKGADAQFVTECNRLAGESLYQLGDRAASIEYLNKYLKGTDAPVRSALYILGLDRYDEGDYEKAVQYLQPVTNGDDAMAQSAYLYIGQALLKESDENAALMAFNNAMKMSWDKDVQEAAFYNYAVTRYAGGTVPFSSSASTFEELLRRFPKSVHAAEVQEYIVAGYISDKNYEGALESIGRMKNPSEATLRSKLGVLNYLGGQALRSGNYKTAREYLNEARRYARYDNSASMQTDLLLGETLYKLSDYNGAAQALLRFINAPGASRDANFTMARYDLGYVRYAQKKYSDARTDFEIALDLLGKNGGEADTPAFRADILNRLADIAYYGSDFAKASGLYGQALELNPSAGDYPMFQQGLMQGYAGNYSQKISSLSEMCSKYPSSTLIPEAMLEITEAKMRLNDNNGAIATFDQIISRYPSSPQARQAYLQKGLVEHNLGREADAENTYKKLIAKYPSSEEAADAVKAMKRITAENGTLESFIAYLRTIPGAPSVDVSEVDKLTYEAAEKDWLENNSTSKLEAYISRYPNGNFRARALEYLFENAQDKGLDAKATSYASELAQKYPDRAGTEDALFYLALNQAKSGDMQQAQRSWAKLAQSASSPEIRVKALEELIIAAAANGDNSTVLQAADVLLGSQQAGEEAKRTAAYYKAAALARNGNEAAAAQLWESLSPATDDVMGAESAYRYADYLFRHGQTEKARTATEKLVNSGTAHNYWLAKGIILLSDIYEKEGKTFEAVEYLKALQEYYPDKEPEILNAIKTRLDRLDKNK